MAVTPSSDLKLSNPVDGMQMVYGRDVDCQLDNHPTAIANEPNMFYCCHP
jgi:hypothetical protein